MSLQTDPEGTETKYLKRFADIKGKHVLEVGCGDGRLIWRYASGAERVTGIDLLQDDLRIATIDRPSDLQKNVNFARADSLHLPFTKKTFDLAIFAWSF